MIVDGGQPIMQSEFMSSCYAAKQILPMLRQPHSGFFCGAKGGGSGILYPGGLGVAPFEPVFEEVFHLEGGGFGTLAIFCSVHHSVFRSDSMNSTAPYSGANIKTLPGKDKRPDSFLLQIGKRCCFTDFFPRQRRVFQNRDLTLSA